MLISAPSIKNNHNTQTANLSRNPGQLPHSKSADMSDDSKRPLRAILSKVTTKIREIGKKTGKSVWRKGLDYHKSQDSLLEEDKRATFASARRYRKAAIYREFSGASGLRRSWLFDRRTMPNITGCACAQKESSRPSAGALFFTLPVELQLEIVTKLIYSDIISLRKTSRSFNALIVTNEHEIARQQIQTFVEPRYVALYPPSIPNKPTFEYLSRLATKSIAASELAKSLATQLYDDFHDKYFDPHPASAKVLIIRYITERLRFSLMIIQHFLEQFAERKLRRDRVNGYSSRADDIQLQEAILEKYYTIDQLVEASDFYRLTLYLLWQNVAMPGDHEKIKRMWAIVTDTLPAVQDLTKFMIVGGIPELRNVYRKKKASLRRKAMSRFSAMYKTEQARSAKAGTTLLPRIHHPSENIKRYSTLVISPNIFHLWIHPAQNVMFRKEVIDGLNQFRCIDEIVELLLEGWEEWAYPEDLPISYDNDDDEDDTTRIRHNCGMSTAAAAH
ncbi:hypothetical protein TWF730_000496 [Orbilia blumenaviensis]|uniref:F-box domain-containing protein n=1 Tax=Orbilia blumenaviensis TaxID=1796055 RepID=A0AAV9VLS2_9PEZI